LAGNEEEDDQPDVKDRTYTAAFRASDAGLVVPDPFPESFFLAGMEKTTSLKTAAFAVALNDSLWPEDGIAVPTDGHILTARKRAPLACNSHSATLHNFLSMTTEPYISSFLKACGYVKGSVELPLILSANTVVTTWKISQPEELTLTMIVTYDIKKDGTGVMFLEGVSLPAAQESARPALKSITHTGVVLVPTGPNTCDMIFATQIKLMRLQDDEYVPAVGMADAFKEQFITNVCCTADLINQFASGVIPQ